MIIIVPIQVLGDGETRRENAHWQRHNAERTRGVNETQFGVPPFRSLK